MQTLGMYLSVPMGFAIFSIIGTAIEILIGEIWWKAMKHYPEDELKWSEGSGFVVEAD